MGKRAALRKGKRLRTSKEDREEKEEHYYSDPRLTLLPDELLLLIFSKITDPKTLLKSSLISKRIASILSLSHSLTLKFHTQFTLSIFNPGVRRNCDLFHWLTNLLCRFRGVRSLRIELPCSCEFGGYPPDDMDFKWLWKAKTVNQCGLFSYLSTKSVIKIDHKKAEGGAEEEEEVEDFHNWAAELAGPSCCAQYAYLYAMQRYRMMLLLILQHPNLENVELVDSKKHGKLSVGGEELIKLRSLRMTMLGSTMLDNWISGFIGLSRQLKLWFVPKLRLPLSGFEMREVALVMVVVGDGVANRSGGDGDFEDDEHGIFGEAMTQMLTKNPFRKLKFRTLE